MFSCTVLLFILKGIVFSVHQICKTYFSQLAKHEMIIMSVLNTKYMKQYTLYQIVPNKVEYSAALRTNSDVCCPKSAT